VEEPDLINRLQALVVRESQPNQTARLRVHIEYIEEAIRGGASLRQVHEEFSRGQGDSALTFNSFKSALRRVREESDGRQQEAKTTVTAVKDVSNGPSVLLAPNAKLTRPIEAQPKDASPKKAGDATGPRSIYDLLPDAGAPKVNPPLHSVRKAASKGGQSDEPSPPDDGS